MPDCRMIPWPSQKSRSGQTRDGRDDRLRNRRTPLGARPTRHSRSRNNTNNAASAPTRPSDEARFGKARGDEEVGTWDYISGREKLSINGSGQERNGR